MPTGVLKLPYRISRKVIAQNPALIKRKLTPSTNNLVVCSPMKTKLTYPFIMLNPPNHHSPVYKSPKKK